MLFLYVYICILYHVYIIWVCWQLFLTALISMSIKLDSCSLLNAIFTGYRILGYYLFFFFFLFLLSFFKHLKDIVSFKNFFCPLFSVSFCVSPITCMLDHLLFSPAVLFLNIFSSLCFSLDHFCWLVLVFIDSLFCCIQAAPFGILCYSSKTCILLDFCVSLP